MTASADVAIIGGGIVGASTAYFTAKYRDTLVIEGEDRPGYHATGRSAAIVVEAYEGPVVRALTRASRRFIDDHGHALAEHRLARRRGQMVIASEARRPALVQRLSELGDMAGAVSLLSGAEARAMCPVLRAEAAAAALWEPEAVDLDVDGLLQGYLRGARRAGAQIVTGARVVRLERAGEQWEIFLADGRTFSANMVINAAGAWAGQIGQLAGATPVPATPMLRTALLVDAPTGHESADWPFVTTIDEEVYFKPDAGKLMVSLADERPVEAHDAWADDEDVALAVDRLQVIADIEVRRVAHCWAGLRTFVPDRRPVVGPDPRAPEFCWAAAVGGFGVQTSPAVGALAASSATGRAEPGLAPSDQVVTAISPARFA